MAASVRIEDEAFSDDRIAALGDLLGLDRYAALGRLAYLWRQATAMGTPVLPAELVARHVDPDHLVSCGLGRRQKGGGVLLTGASDRVMWLKNKRESGRANGAKGAEFGKLGGRPRKTPTEPGKGVSENPPSASASASTKRDLLSDAASGADVARVEPPEAVNLARLLAEAIESRAKDQPKDLRPDKREKTIASWARTFRLAHEIDGRPWPRMLAVLEWSQADSFWKTNIRSASKFREQFDALAARMDQPAQKPGGRQQPEPPKYKDEGYVT